MHAHIMGFLPTFTGNLMHFRNPLMRKGQFSSCDSELILATKEIELPTGFHYFSRLQYIRNVSALSKSRANNPLGIFISFCTGKHFDRLLRKYGSPIICLNLVKKRERKRKHESLLSEEFSKQIEYLNLFVPESWDPIQYIHFDMARSKKR